MGQSLHSARIMALSIRQPWAWLLIHGGKDIENRSWYTAYRGPLAIHASKSMLLREYEEAVEFVRSFDRALAARIPKRHKLELGQIIGTAILSRCVTRSDSPWFCGPFGFVLSQAKPIPAIPASGRLGLWPAPTEVLV